MKTGAEALGITRPEIWFKETNEAALKLTEETADIISDFITLFLSHNYPEAIPAMNIAPIVTDITAKIAKFTFILGYIKGVQIGEDRANRDKKLKKLLGEE